MLKLVEKTPKQPRPSRKNETRPVHEKRSAFIIKNDLNLISGKWIWIHDGEGQDLHRFKVKYITNKGQIKHCLARSALSSDIKEAMLVTGGI